MCRDLAFLLLLAALWGAGRIRDGRPSFSSMEMIKIVARYTNGQVIKGYVHDFFPNKPLFHLYRSDSTTSRDSVEVLVKDLKAVFFVRDFAGNPDYRERKEFPEGEKPPGRKVEVRFRDGEVIVGSTLSFDTQRAGFFIFPSDPQANNLKVFAVMKALSKVRFL